MASDAQKARPRPRPLPEPEPNPQAEAPRRAAGLRGRVLRAVGWLLAASLAVLNGWWLWRDVRPVADLNTAARWITQGHSAEAEWALREQIRRSPHDGEALMLLARVLAQRNDTLGCARVLHRIPTWYPDKWKMLFLEGTAFESLDRAADAEAAWKALTALDPLHPMPADYVFKAALRLMDLYANEERWPEAHALLWKVYDQADPSERPRLLIMRMRTELERVAPARAAAKLRKLVEAVPDDWEARRALAHAEYASGNVPEATRLITECLEARPADPRAWREYLAILHEHEADALGPALEKVPSAAADDPEVLKYRAGLLEREGDWSGAAAIYRRMVEAQPFNGDYLYKLAMAEERTGKRVEAREHRNRSRAVRDARADLAQALQAYLDLSRAREPDPRALASSVRRLATLSEALGWTREAKAWALLAPTE